MKMPNRDIMKKLTIEKNPKKWKGEMFLGQSPEFLALNLNYI